MSGPPRAGAKGIQFSVAASVLFAGIYFLTPFLHPASAESLWGIRSLLSIPMILLALAASRQWPQVTAIWHRVRARPSLIAPLLCSAILIALQVWVFGWAPLHGRGLQVSLGYFLLPLVLVVVGRALYKDRLTWSQWAAAGVAAVGVAYELVRVGGISWETLVVALGYPVYFVLRRKLGTDHLGGMIWDFCLLAPLAVWFVAREILSTSALTENPVLWWLAPVYAGLTGVALVCYLTASRLVSISIFGLLSYLEPALLMVASLLNGEQIAPGELVMYAAIWLAVLIIVTGGITQVIRARRR